MTAALDRQLLALDSTSSSSSSIIYHLFPPSSSDDDDVENAIASTSSTPLPTATATMLPISIPLLAARNMFLALWTTACECMNRRNSYASGSSSSDQGEEGTKMVAVGLLFTFLIDALCASSSGNGTTTTTARQRKNAKKKLKKQKQPSPLIVLDTIPLAESNEEEAMNVVRNRLIKQLSTEFQFDLNMTLEADVDYSVEELERAIGGKKNLNLLCAFFFFLFSSSSFFPCVSCGLSDSRLGR